MLRLSNLSVSYGKRRVLDDVTFDVESGEVVALVGPNGAGKSTLIRAVSGVVPMQSGEVRINGEALHKLSTMERARYLAVVPQARSLPPAFTVYEAVLLGRTPHLGWLGRTGEAIMSACSTPWSIPSCCRWRSAMWANSRAASSSACCWRAPWRRIRPCCCWMSRPRTWTCSTARA